MLLFEPAGTVNTGNVTDDRTRNTIERILIRSARDAATTTSRRRSWRHDVADDGRGNAGASQLGEDRLRLRGVYRHQQAPGRLRVVAEVDASGRHVADLRAVLEVLAVGAHPPGPVLRPMPPRQPAAAAARVDGNRHAAGPAISVAWPSRPKPVMSVAPWTAPANYRRTSAAALFSIVIDATARATSPPVRARS